MARVVRLALPLLTLAVWLDAGGAPGHKAGYGSFIVLTPTALSDTTIDYAGQVNSESKLCRAGRALELFVGGNHLTTVTTDRAGGWSVTGVRPAQGTEVTAAVSSKVKRTRRHRHRCAADSITKKAP
jgi:hypothetical protein